jgi:hypothetical protein
VFFQDFAYTNKIWLVVFDDAGVGRKRNFAIGKGIQRIDGFIARIPGHQVNEDFDVLGRVVVDFLDFDFAFVVGLDDGFDQARGVSSKWNFGN